MNDALRALEAVKNKHNIMEPVTEEQEIEKTKEVMQREVRNAPARSKKQMEVDYAKSIEDFYAKGNKVD